MNREHSQLLTLERETDQDQIERFLAKLRAGRDWPEAILESMADWTVPFEDVDGRTYHYVIGGEAFDWLVLAERLCEAAEELVPGWERDALLFFGQMPARFDRTLFKELIGPRKHSGYLNFFYGVTVEESLQYAVEREVHKRHLGNGNQYQEDFSDEAFTKIYHESKPVLLDAFREETGLLEAEGGSLHEMKELTYWLFKYRIRTADKAKVASDTRKGLEQLRRNSRPYSRDFGPY